MPLSVLIPAYNAAATIHETLDSIAKQSPAALALIDQVIVADDGSTDTTRDVVTRFANASTLPIELWNAKENAGERTVVNRSFQRLREEGTDWCMVLHADDVAKPHWSSSIIDRINGTSDSAVSICSSWDDWYPDRIILGEDDFSKADVIIRGSVESAKDTLKSGCWWHFSGCAMNLKGFFEVEPFCEDMPQLGDLEWLIRSQLKALDVVYIPRTLIKYRQSHSNVSSVSFRTNRDLKEATMIASRHIANYSIRPAVSNYARQYLKLSLRRTLTSLVLGNPKRAFSAAGYATRLLKLSLA